MVKNCANKQLLAYIINFIRKNEEIMDIIDEEWIDDIQSDLGQQILNYEKIILQRAKNSKKLKKILPLLIQSLNHDQKVKIYIQKQKQKPLYVIISKIKPSIININNFFSSGVQVQEWTINLIVKNNLQKQLQFIQQWLKKSQKIQDFISLSLNYVIDYLIRRMDLTHFINSIHKVMRNNFNINQMSELILLRKISIYDFLVLLVKSIDQTQHPQIGNLFYKNRIPLPIINRSLNDNNQKQIHYFPYLLEQILSTKKIKLIFSFGMPINIIKEKESLIYDLFRINCQNNILSQCNFYDGCVSFHANIPEKQFQLCIVAIYHSFKEESDINQSEVQFFIKNSAIIILHTTYEQFNDKDKKNSVRQQINKLKDSSKGQVLTVIHNFDKKLKQIQEQNIMIFPSFRNEIDTVDRKEWLSNMRQRIKQLLKKKNLKQLQMNNIIDKNQLKRLIYDRQQIQGLIKLLNEAKNKSNFYEQVFPNLWRERIMSKLCNQKNTLQIQLYDKQMNDQNISKKYNELEKLQNRINYQEQNKIELKRSQALNYFLSKLEKLKFQNYTHNLAEWKNKETEEIQKQILQLKSKLQYSKLQENKLKLIKLTEEYELYDLSLDTFIQQIIIAEQNMKQGEKDVKLKNMVFDYYQRLHKKNSPINLIQGKTLKFGNQILENFFYEMSKKMVSDKKICVISVIGSQSSAKSTLMNYLFNCSFPTSSGRCTKGVYFTMLQNEESIIIVIDTEGLLSICNRDQTFDVLMASFILLISDLIIINNKGEINVIIKDLLGICIYCLKSLNDGNKQIIKNKLIFVIRDLADEGIQKQQAILSNIISTLTSELNMFNYMDYIDLTSQDIYPLQSAYIQRPLQSYLVIEENNTCFGHSIIVLRQKILKLLLSRKTIHNNIYQFYKESQKKWKLIKQCGINIFNYKYILEKKIKKDLIQKMQKITKHYQFQLRKQSQKFSKQLNQNSKIDIIKKQVNQIILECIKNSKLKFKEEIKEIKGTKERWINDICLQMEDLFKYRYRNLIQILSRRIKQQKIRSQKILFQEQVDKIIQCIFKQNKTQDQIIIQFQNKFQMLIKKQNILLQQKNRSILQQLQNQIQKQQQDKIKIYAIQTSLTYKQWSKNKYKLIKKSNCQDKKKENQILSKITQKDQNFKKDLQKLVEQQHDFEFLSVENFLAKINNLCKSHLQSVQKTINIEDKKENFQVQQGNFQEYLFSIVRQIVHSQVKIRQQFSKTQLLDEQNKMFLQKINKINQNFKTKGNAKKIASMWLDDIRNNIQNKCFDKLKITLKGLVDQAIQNLYPETMIKKALDQSFCSLKTDKTTWLKCYKVVVNINQFLKQILYQTAQIKKIYRQLQCEKQKIFKKMIQKYQNYEKLIKQCRNNLGPNNTLEECAKKLEISVCLSSQKSNQTILQQILIILEIQYQQTMNIAQKYFQQTIYGNQSHYLLLRKQIETKVQRKALGCEKICPMCHIKCKKSKDHTGGHEAIQNSHLMCCFGGVQYRHDKKGSQQCCFTQATVLKNVMYPQKNKDKKITVLKHIEQNYPLWFNHFKQGPYQTKVNQQRCRKAWSNIGQMLIKKNKYSHIVNPSTKFNDYYDKNTALKLKDISELKGYN